MTAQNTDFPVPADLEGFWTWDRMHGPRPFTPFSEDLFIDGISTGFTRGMMEFACPVGFDQISINGYAYVSMSPVDLGNETMDDRVARYQATVHDALPRLGDLWENEWLPAMIPALDEAKTRDYGALSDQGLLDTMNRMREEFTDRYTVHGKINFVAMSASLYADYYIELFSPDDPMEPYETLQGFPTKSLDAGHGLWRLSRQIVASPEITNVFNESEVSDILSELEKSEPGRAFLVDLRAYLDEFGWRTDIFEFADLTWREDPTIPLNTLQGFIRLGNDADPSAKYANAAAKREELLATARKRIADDPEKLGKFNGLFEMARHYLTLTENHNYYIDQIGNGVMRLPALEIGRRLAQNGSIDDSNDVFMLHIDEFSGALAGGDVKATISERKSELDRWSKVMPVPAIGQPPEPSGDPMEAAFEKMFGMPPEPTGDPNVIQGIGASAGVVQGTAKVVTNLNQASKLQQGDIMVCEMTMPPWTPLFSTVSAVVADTGGVLSHCAIVSREYGMPCVVGTQMGTAIIQDGMSLTVDGSTGMVRIDSRP